MNNKLFSLLLIPALLFSTNVVRSDDTEIYLNNNSAEAGKPLVMLTLDYRPNLSSRVCNDYDPADPTSDCWNMFWECTAYQVDPTTGGFTLDGNGNKICTTGTPWLPNPTDVSVPYIPVDPDSVTFFEAFVAALNIVFERLLEEKGEEAFRLGMMLNNADSTNGQCGAGQGLAGRNNNRKCSNGGYVFLGFNDFTYEYKAQFIVKLLGLIDVLPQGNVSHNFQGAELYMELFRYLTGQDVLNGHNGYDNFNSSDGTSNMGYTLGFTGDDIPRIIIPDGDDRDGNAFDNAKLGWDATVETAYAATVTATTNYVSSVSVAGLTPIDVSTINGPGEGNKEITYDTPDALNPNNSDPDLYRYISPFTENCSRVYVINFMFAVSSQENDSDDFIEAATDEQGLGITVSNSNAFTDVISALNRFDLSNDTWGDADQNYDDVQNVKSFFYIDESQYQQALSKGYAQAGGTVTPRKISGDPEQLVTNLINDLSSILSISTTFVSATVPVNVFNRSESLNNVFFGIFEAEEAEQWPGNIKRLQLYVDPNDATETLQVVDANGVEAIATANDSGRISNSALTFWTNPGGFDVVAFDADKDEQSGFDGRSVNRGGAGQQLQGFLTDNPSAVNGSRRTFYTVSSTMTSGNLIDFDADLATAATPTALRIWPDICHAIQGTTCGNWSGGNPTDADTLNSNAIINDPATNDQQAADNLIKFARGIDIYDQDGDGEINDARPWMFGDILHSQPTPVNYGALGDYDPDNPDLRILVASNDGYIRMIRNSDPNNTVQDPVEVDENGDPLLVPEPDGSEVWAFMPSESLYNLGYLANNDGTNDHPYGPDSSLTLYTEDVNNDGTLDYTAGDKVYVYFGMRRGGDAIYALDISNPDAPALLWKIDKDAVDTNTPNFYQLGQTWSRPRVRKLDWGDGVKPVVIFAGGYDDNKDDRSGTGTDDDEGNAIFIVDAVTGELVWKAVQQGTHDAYDSAKLAFTHEDLVDSIPSDTTPLDANGDGIVDRVYVGDTGGVVWRVDLIGSTRSDWQITPILNVGRHATDEPDRRFFHRPDVVPALDELLANEPFDGILIGSGNRPNPRQVFDDDEYDQFYMLKDKNTTLNPVPGVINVNAATTPADMADMTSSVASDLDLTTDCNVATSDCGRFSKGWYISFIEEGEKLLASSLTFFGKTFFSTYLPNGGDDSATCAPPEGSASTYAINLQDASPLAEYGFTGDTLAEQRHTITGHGIPSDPVIIALDGNIYVTPGNIAPTPAFRKKVAGNPLRKTFWYELEK